MKNWYKTRDKIAGSQHRGQELLPNKFIKMTDAQAAMHNQGKKEPSLIEADNPPKSVADCQFADEFEEKSKGSLVKSQK